VGGTWRVVTQAGVEALGRLLAHLVEKNPNLRPFFLTERHQHARKMFIFMNQIMEQLGNLEELVPSLEALGRRHLAYNCTTKEDHLAMQESLFWLLDQYLGDQFTDEVKSAWTITYDAVCRVMLKAAEQYAAANGGMERFTNGRNKGEEAGDGGLKEEEETSPQELHAAELVLIRETWPSIRTVVGSVGHDFDLLRIHVKEKFPEKKKYRQCLEFRKLYESQQKERSAAAFLAQVGYTWEQVSQHPPDWAVLHDHFTKIGKAHSSRAAIPDIQELGKVVMLVVTEALGNLYTQQAFDAWDKLVHMVLEWFALGASEKKKSIFFKRSNSGPVQEKTVCREGSGSFSITSGKNSGSNPSSPSTSKRMVARP